MIEFDATLAITFALYTAVMIAVGTVACRRTKDLSDYILGGRKLGSGVTALSAGASDMSGWLLLGLPGYAYLAGLEATWIAAGLLAGTYLNWRIVAYRLRLSSELLDNSLTLPDYFARRFNDRSGVLRVVSALFILVFFTFYAGAGLVASGKLFETVFGIPHVWAVAGGGGAIILYTFLGGFLAVSWTDFLQGILMMLALVMVSIFAIIYLGGPADTAHEISSVNRELLDPLTGITGDALTWLAVISLAGWGLGYFGQPHILARFMAIREPGRIPRSRRIAMTWVVTSMAGALIAGWSGIGIIDPALSEADSEKVFLILTGILFHPVPAGICLAAILAAIMSTADSQLLVASSALTEDLYKAILRKNAGAGELLWIGRSAVIFIAVIAGFLAVDPDSKVLDLVSYAWAGFGASFGPAIIFSLFNRNTSRNGVLAGITTGGLTVILWDRFSGGIFDLYEIIPAFLLSSVTIYGVSCFDTVRRRL